MNVRKFLASTTRDALRKVKETLGPDAIILSNRSVSGGVEIIAVSSSEMALAEPKPRVQSKPSSVAEPADYTVTLSRPASTPPSVQKASSASAVNSADVFKQAPSWAQAVAKQAEPERAELTLPVAPVQAAAEVVPPAVLEEIRALRRMVEQQLAGFAWGESARSAPVKTEVLRQMLDAGFSPQLSRDLLADLPHRFDSKNALAWVKAEADRSFRTLDTENDIVDRGGVYALVGPTGVGKTTTTAKLAARCVLRHGASKVALVTTDGYRIGAHEQLRIYGRILGVSVHLVKDGEDLQQTLQDLQHKHMVLIDTMGMSQRDPMLEEQISMFSASQVKRLLLLSATNRGDTLDDVVHAYSGVGAELAGCILSKVDEAASLAGALDVIMRHGLRLHYVSNGQRVPEDLHLPNRHYLLHRAFKELPEHSPHRLEGVESAMALANTGAMPLLAGGRRA
ncbi:MAG: flagellar biosynthesis protein FlhF [Pseudomonadota bacterium]